MELPSYVHKYNDSNICELTYSSGCLCDCHVISHLHYVHVLTRHIQIILAVSNMFTQIFMILSTYSHLHHIHVPLPIM